MGTCCADHVTPLYPQKLALTSPTGGGRSVGIVRVRTKATEFLCCNIRWSLCIAQIQSDISLFVSLNMGKVRRYAFKQLPALLLRSLRSGLHVPNLIRLAVFGSLYLKGTARQSVFLVWC